MMMMVIAIAMPTSVPFESCWSGKLRSLWELASIPEWHCRLYEARYLSGGSRSISQAGRESRYAPHAMTSI
eukprot:279194-Amphidinium_carterae.1